jgi:hypothetical protein
MPLSHEDLPDCLKPSSSSGAAGDDDDDDEDEEGGGGGGGAKSKLSPEEAVAAAAALKEAKAQPKSRLEVADDDDEDDDEEEDEAVTEFNEIDAASAAVVKPAEVGMSEADSQTAHVTDCATLMGLLYSDPNRIYFRSAGHMKVCN